MKRYVVAFFAFAVIAVPATGFAQIDAAALQAQIQALLAQIKSLNDQMQALQTQKQQVVTNLLTTLKEGSQGDSVTTLQALLAADPELYPEGLITGFYGRLTSAAVKRFQKKYGIEQVGFVGPKTLKKLNEFFNEHPVAFEKDTDDDDDDDNSSSSPSGIGISRRICAKIAPGHLIAPGWLRKHNGERPIVPLCQNLPPGIITNPNWPWPTPTSTPTSTPDTTAPVISNVVASVGADSATVSWTTNEVADTQISYGTSTPYGAMTSLNSTLTTSHSQTLSGLLPSTTYHYQVMSKDGVGNLATSTDQTFTTLVQGDVSVPILSSLVVTPGSSTILFTWNTNETTNSKVYYSTVTPIDVNASTTASVFDATTSTSHSVMVSGLATSTQYQFVVESADAANNKGTSSGSATTLAL